MLKKMIVLEIFIVMLLTGAAAAAEQSKAITIRLNWIPNAMFAGILLAKERGWYDGAGINLTIKGWKQGISSINEVVSGAAQIGVAEGGAIIIARVAGKAVKAIAVQYQKSPFCLMSKKAMGIKTPEQLAGKKIGLNCSESKLMTQIVLAHQGMRFKDIIPVQTGWALKPLIDDKIDVFAAFMTDEPLAMQEQGYEVTYIPAFKYGYDFYSGAYFVTDTLIREQPQLIRIFLKVTLRGWQEAFKTPAETAKLIIKKYYPKGSLNHETEEIKRSHTLATLGVGNHLIGMMEERFWSRGVDILYKYKQIDKKIPATDLFTLEFLKEVTTTR
ncbi:ABC transporter substrate-binding protein [Desulfococcaceae bacterium HSG9]|nr:ABC transporter substrate-binding protein [Desulfococcaceae bacterium HSG9]